MANSKNLFQNPPENCVGFGKDFFGSCDEYVLLNS